jgi:hypothetical protein
MTSLPAHADEITADWMTQMLQQRFPGVVIDSIRQTHFIDGTAQKLRFELDYAPGWRFEGAPNSLWVKGGFDPKGVIQGDAFANEVRFFADIAPDLRCLVPQSYGGAIDKKTNNGVVLLEDLLVCGATFGSATSPLSPDQAARVLELLAAVHAQFWGPRRINAPDWLRPGGSIAATGMVDQYFGLWPMAAPLPRFSHLTATQRDRPRMQAALNALMTDLRRRGDCLLHGDSQAGNLFFNRGGQPGYLDWQHCMLGVWAFDVCGMLVPGLTVEDRRRHQHDLLHHYLGALVGHGVEPPPFEQAWFDYARYAIWAFMWTMCPVTAHPEEVCSLNSERACAAIEDLGSVQKLLGH